jgi:hypothetical protein
MGQCRRTTAIAAAAQYTAQSSSYGEPSSFPTVELPGGTFRAKKRCPLKGLGDRKAL